MHIVSNLSAGYGDIVAVRDFSFSVGQGKILSLLGANGAGKTSTLLSLVGLVERKSGTIMLDGADLSSAAVEDRITKGLAIVPEGRRIFPDLSVHENLIVGGHIVAQDVMEQGIEKVFGYFPRLRERRDQAAGSLSGGGIANARHGARADFQTKTADRRRVVPGTDAKGRR